MKLLICGIALALCFDATAEYLPEPIPVPISGNIRLGKQLLINSDLIAIGADESSGNPRVFDIGSV